MNELDMEKIAEGDRHYRKSRDIGTLQTVVYVMCGGGHLGRLAAEQPADFYLDSRTGKLPYPARQIEQAVKVLETIAACRGLNPHKLPSRPDFHGCGIF